MHTYPILQLDPQAANIDDAAMSLTSEEQQEVSHELVHLYLNCH